MGLGCCVALHQFLPKNFKKYYKSASSLSVSSIRIGRQTTRWHLVWEKKIHVFLKGPLVEMAKRGASWGLLYQTLGGRARQNDFARPSQGAFVQQVDEILTKYFYMDHAIYKVEYQFWMEEWLVNSPAAALWSLLSVNFFLMLLFLFASFM